MVCRYLGTEASLLKVCRQELITNHHMPLLMNTTSGCQVLLQNDRNDDLRRMYVVAWSVGGCVLVCSCLHVLVCRA